MKQIKLSTGLIFIALFSLIVVPVKGQSKLTLQQCQQQAIENSPLQKQKIYLESIAQLNSRNYQALNYPRLMLNSQATYQSDVFSLPFRVPGVETPVIPKDQYKVGVDFYQNIYNGGVSKAATRIEEAKSAADVQALDVNFQQIREVINNLFFGIIKAQEQIEILENTQQDLHNQKSVLEALVDEGAALPMSIKILDKEIITLEQRLVEIEYYRSALLTMLGKWLAEDIAPDVMLEIPNVNVITAELSLRRPESRQFDLKQQLLEAQKSQLAASRIPDIGIFGTAGMGYPNPLNWFDLEFSPYWMAGIKLSWNILDYGKTSRTREVLGLNQQNLITARENFERTLEINTEYQKSDITKYEQLIDKDTQILQLQNEITQVAESQLQNGIINSNDYIQEVNKGLNAQISLKLHQINLVKAKIDLLTLTGNFE